MDATSPCEVVPHEVVRHTVELAPQCCMQWCCKGDGGVAAPHEVALWKVMMMPPVPHDVVLLLKMVLMPQRCAKWRCGR